MQTRGYGPALPVSTLALAIGVALGSFSTAQAQQLEEIIVTAERRELNLQETPISVMSFEGEALELRGVDDMFELATVAPNLDIKGARGVGNTSPTIPDPRHQRRRRRHRRARRRFLRRQRLHAANDGSRHAHPRRRAHRGAARPTGHAVRPQQHGRRHPRVLDGSRTPSETATCNSRSATSTTRICRA